MASVNNYEDVIDSRDVIAAVDVLEDDIACWESDIGDHESEISDREVDIDDLVSEQADLDNDKNSGEIDDLENQIDSLRADIESIEGTISLIRADIQEAQDDLTPLTNLASECEGYSSDWNHGEALIRYDHFEDYARQMAEDIGAVDNTNWPNCHIDWEAAAEALQMDYTEVDFDGVNYWIR